MMRIMTRFALVAALAAGTGACSDILDVENPNNLIEDDLGDVTAASSIVNGASGIVAKGVGAVLGPYSVATDEAIWVGSRDAWRELDAGNLGDPRNEFTDDAFTFFAQGRWMADEAVDRIKAFDDAGVLVNRALMARAYLYAAIEYITIGDMFDDFVIGSDKQDAAPPVGASNMSEVYDIAIEYLDAAAPIAAAAGDDELHFAVLATRARAHHSKGIWEKVNPVNTTAPLVDVPAAVADADAALAIAPDVDWRSVLVLSTDDLAYAGEASIAYNVNQRRELQLGPTYVTLTADRRTVTGVALMDPIDDEPAPAVVAEVARFVGAYVNQPITYASVRELYLIKAEAALAQGDMVGFTTAINQLRALDDLTPYAGQIPAVDLLIHSRQANLFMQGRRLADLYRFGLDAAEWQQNSTAVQAPGTFLPITCIELRANENLQGTC